MSNSLDFTRKMCLPKRCGEQVTVAGTGRGADTALLMTGATSGNLKAMHISRILCKPL